MPCLQAAQQHIQAAVALQVISRGSPCHAVLCAAVALMRMRSQSTSIRLLCAGFKSDSA